MAKKKTSKYSFGAKMNKVIEHEEARKQGFGYLKLPEDVKTFDSNTDQNKVDIIPYIVTDARNLDIEISGIAVGDPWYRKAFYVHRGIGPNEETIVCPTTVGKKCPICEHVSKLRKEGAEYEDVKDMYRKLRYLYNVVPVDDEDHEEEIHVWDYSDFLFERKLVDEVKKGNVDPEFASPEEGQTLKIRWIEEHFGKNKFGKAGAVDGMSRSAYDEKIIEDAPKLDDILIIYSYKKLEGMYLDLEDEDYDETEEEPEKETKSVRNSYKKKEEEVEEEEEEEEEEEKPKKKGKKPFRRRGETNEDEENKCPHGYVFGVDTEEYEECEKCKVYDACLDAKLEK